MEHVITSFVVLFFVTNKIKIIVNNLRYNCWARILLKDNVQTVVHYQMLIWGLYKHSKIVFIATLNELGCSVFHTTQVVQTSLRQSNIGPPICIRILACYYRNVYVFLDKSLIASITTYTSSPLLFDSPV